jgi:hypothetical protein
VVDDGSRLGREPDIRWERERIISSPDNKEAQEIASRTVTEFMVQDLVTSFKGVINKTDILQEQIKKTAKDRIPVHPQAHEVRHAIRTLWRDRLEDFIFLDQYIEAVEYEFKRNAMDPVLLMNKLTGNLEVDNRIIDQTQWTTSEGISPEDLAVIAGQYALCLVANRIMQPYQAPDVQKQTAVKLQPGTESGAMLGQVLIGLAALLLQVVENTDEIKGLLDETVGQLAEFNNLEVEEIISQAKAQERDPLIDKYNTSQRPYFYDVIRRYVVDWLENNTEPGYEGWMVYNDLASKKADSGTMLAELSNYAGSEDKTGVQTREGQLETQASAQMARSLYRMAYCQAVAANEQLDMVAAILDSKYTADMICCLVMLFGAIPTEQLRLIRFILAVSANGISLNMGGAFRGLSGRTNQWLAERVVEPVMHSVHRFWDSIKSRVLQLIDRDEWEDKELYDILMACTPIDELFELIVNGLESLEKALQQLISAAWDKLETKNVEGKFALRLMADSKKSKVLLGLLDKVLELIEQGNLCIREGGVTPSPEEIEDLVNKVSMGLPGPLEIPVGGAPFETFNPEPFKSELGLNVQVPSLPKQEDGTTTFRVPDCLRQQTGIKDALKTLGLGIQMDRDLNNARIIDPAKKNP